MAQGPYEVYKVTNSLNGDCYIGITSRGTKQRWRDHCRHARQDRKRHQTPFYKAIRQYGARAFVPAVLGTGGTKKDAISVEIALIAHLKPAYNATRGGEGTYGHLVSEEGRRRMSEANLGNKYNLGRRWTEEQKAEMRAKKAGCAAPPLSPLMQETRIANFRIAAVRRRKPVWCLNTGELFPSVRAAEGHYGISHGGVRSVASGKYRQVLGLVFRYAT